MTNRPLIGLVLAVLLEASHWTKFRWDFDDEACSRAWQFTSIGIGLATVLIWLDGDRYTALPNLLTWLPPLLLPMQFVQSFGLRNSMPLNTFSFLAKHRRKRNRRLGLTEATIFINFGNVYFVIALVSATLGSRSNANNWAFLLGVVGLTGWRLLSSTRSRPTALILSLIVAGGIAVAGQIGIEKAEDWLSNRSAGGFEKKFSPTSVSTMIGKPGLVQQSSDIIWRLAPQAKTSPPRLLRIATYNNYRAPSWETQRVSLLDFKDVDLAGTGADAYYRLKENADANAVSPSLPRFSLRGAAAEETPLPLPGDAASLKDFALDGIERNTFGCIRVYPKESVIEGVVLWKGGTNPDAPPLAYEDLKVPIYERRTIRRIAGEIGLLEPSLASTWNNPQTVPEAEWNISRYEPPEIPPIFQHKEKVRARSFQEKLALIREFFLQNFTYSRELYIVASSKPKHRSRTGIGQFLTNNRSGHCEYFATATVLLLREAGIPARYATGFAVMERNQKHNEYVIRGTHGHAWCRVWDKSAGVWIDFDTTPPSWTGQATPPNSSTQWFSDAVMRIREDFFLWRNRPQNRLAVTFIMSAIALGVIAFVMKRLWRSKRRLETRAAFNNYEGPAIRTPLHDLEPHARKYLGFRPLGQPFAEWLVQLRPSIGDSAVLDEAIALHQRLRFDPQPPPAGELERLSELVTQLSVILKRRPHRVG